MLVYSIAALDSAGVSVGEARLFVTAMMDTLKANNRCLHLDECMLPETNTAIAQYLDGCSQVRGPYDQGFKHDRGWLEKHMNLNGLDDWLDHSDKLFDDEDAVVFPGVNILTLRQCDIIQLKGVDTLPHSPASIINVNLSVTWAGRTEGKTCAVVPTAQLFHTERCRLPGHQAQSK
jgi:hypothetical protein